MNVGDYVRTKDGYISKIKELGINIYTDAGCWSEDYVIKSSPNIIDLIEVGDYVNGRKVYQVGYNFQDCLVLKMSINKDGTANDYEDFIYEEDIKSIVTKEQFESMEYKVGD